MVVKRDALSPISKKAEHVSRLLLLVVTIVTAKDHWLETLRRPLFWPGFAEGTPTFDKQQDIASITQDSNKHSSNVAGKVNQFTNNYDWVFLNIHLSSVGYIGIGFPS